MQLNAETLDNRIVKVNLSGKLDLLGAATFDKEFAALVGNKDAFLLVDLSKVSFLASSGIRILISMAKVLSKHGGRMVLFKPQPNVLEVLQTSGVPSLIPIYDDIQDASDALIFPFAG